MVLNPLMSACPGLLSVSEGVRTSVQEGQVDTDEDTLPMVEKELLLLKVLVSVL